MSYARAFLLMLLMPAILAPTARAIEPQTVLTDGAVPGGGPREMAAKDPSIVKDRAESTEGKAKACKQRAPGKMVFSHIGVVTTEKKPGERFVPATRVWVTDFRNHPYHVEWLRYEPNSPVTGPVREMPHVAYKVDSIKAAAKGMKELLAPFDAGIAVVGFYQTNDGAVVEFMEMKGKK